MKVVAVLPAFNVQATIGGVIIRAEKHVDEVVVVDDGSGDLTPVLAERLGAKVLRHQGNLGKGAALRTGFRYVREAGFDVIVTLDSDGQHDPNEIPNLIAPIMRGEADVVNGCRRFDAETPFHRRVGNRLLTALTRKPNGVRDTQSGFRAYSRRAIESIDIRSSGMEVDSEILNIAREAGLRTVEVPISVRYRGVKKPSSRSPIRHGLEVSSFLLKIFVEGNPLLYLGLPGIMLIVLGMAAGLRVVDIFSHTRLIAVGTALISVILLLAGFTSLVASFILYAINLAFKRINKRDEP